MGKALLIIVLGFATIFSGIMFKITSNQQRSSRAIVEQYEKWIAQNVSESVTNVAISKLYQPPVLSWQSGFSSLSFNGASYSVSITNITTDSTTEAKKIQVTTVATYENESDTTIAVLMQPAYSYYSYFANRWLSSLVYDTGDTLTGPIHSNEFIQISNSPVFLAKVSSDETTYQGVTAPDPKFYGGLELGTQTIPLPNLTALIDSANAGGDVHASEVWLQFNGTTYDVFYDPYITLDVTNNLSDYNGTIMTTGLQNIHVKGVVDGQVTVLSDQDIFIEEDIVYANDPRVNPNSDDFLGLIASHRIEIPDNGTMNLEIHAAMVANEQFRVENYDLGLARGTLTILGSLVVEQDGPSGTYTSGTLVTGFDRIHIYDSRLRDKTPPYFPRLDRVEMLFRSD
jgi:hypothetical protein